MNKIVLCTPKANAFTKTKNISIFVPTFLFKKKVKIDLSYFVLISEMDVKLTLKWEFTYLERALTIKVPSTFIFLYG